MKDISKSTVDTSRSAKKEIKRLVRLRDRAKKQETKERHDEEIFKQLRIVMQSIAQAFSELA